MTRDDVRLPDEIMEVSPGVRLRAFSVQHLLWNNLRSHCTPTELSQALVEIAVTSRDWPSAGIFLVVAKRLSQRYHSPLNTAAEQALGAGTISSVLDTASDQTLIREIIQLGHLIGLSSYPNYPIEADLLWAAAAAIIRVHGSEHPNELRDET